MSFDKNIKQVSCVKVPNLIILCKHYFTLGQKFDFKKLSTLLIGSVFIEVTFLSQMSTFSRKLHHHWNCREQKKFFQTILVIVFWNFTIF